MDHNMEKNYMVTVRLTEEEINGLDSHTRGPLTRSQIIRILLNDFLGKTVDEQRQFLVKQLFGPSRVK